MGVAEEAGIRIASQYAPGASVVLHRGDCLDLLHALPAGAARLVVTSPPYNLGKAYERRRPLDAYLAEQSHVIAECIRVLADDGSICWQVGNHVAGGEVFPLDILLYPLFKRHGLALPERGDLVLDPCMGVGSTAVAAVRHDRRTVGAETDPHYVRIAHTRVRAAARGRLRTRPLGRPIYTPSARHAVARRPEAPTITGAPG